MDHDGRTGHIGKQPLYNVSDRRVERFQSRYVFI